jgi:hypothetical protein
MVCPSISVTNKSDHNKTRGRLMHREEKNIKIDPKESGRVYTEFIWLNWWVLVTLATSFWVLQNARIFLVW